MSDVITEYKKWKQQGEDLRVQAKQAMETRYHELLAESVQIAKEYRADFGEPLKPPSPITAFRYKGSAKSKPKKAAAERPAAKNLREAPSACAIGREAQRGNCWTSEAAGDGEEEAR